MAGAKSKAAAALSPAFDLYRIKEDPGWSLAGLVGLDGAVEVGLGWWFRGESDLRSVCRFRFSVVGGWFRVASESRSGYAVFGFRFAGVVFAALVLLALRALLCVALRCLAFVFVGSARLGGQAVGGRVASDHVPQAEQAGRG